MGRLAALPERPERSSLRLLDRGAPGTELVRVDFPTSQSLLEDPKRTAATGAAAVRTLLPRKRKYEPNDSADHDDPKEQHQKTSKPNQ